MNRACARAANGCPCGRQSIFALNMLQPYSERRIAMLILTRRPGESLYVGDSIRITVLSLQGRQVKIGIDLPADMIVYREEIYQRVKEENRRAIETSNEDLFLAASLWHESKK